MAPRRGKKAATTAVAEPVESDADQDSGKPVKVETKATKPSKNTKSSKALKTAEPTEQNHETNDDENAPAETKSKKGAPKKTVKPANQVEANDENTAPANAKVKPAKQTTSKKNDKQSEANDTETNDDDTAEAVNGAAEDAEKPSGRGRSKKKVDAPKVAETKASKGKSKKIETQSESKTDEAPQSASTSKADKKATKAKSAKKEDTIEEAEKAPETKSKRGAAKKAEPAKKPKETEQPASRRGRAGARANSVKQEEQIPADENDESADDDNVIDSPKKPKGRGRKVAASAKTSKTKPTENDTVDEDNAAADEANKAVDSPKGRKRKPANVNAITTQAKKAKVFVMKVLKVSKVSSAKGDVVDGGSGSKGKASPKKRKADTKGPADSTTNDNDTGDELVTKRKKATKGEDKGAAKTKSNPTATNHSEINFETDKVFNMKIVSWNVSGLRSLVGKDGLQYFEHEKPDIICLQEIKCLEDEVPAEAKLKGYHPYWCSTPGGRGGVAVLSKSMPYNVDKNIGNEEMDEEGRIISLEYSKFYLVCVYVPNAGRKLINLDRRLRWNQLFEDHVNKLKAKKPVIIVGDMNVAHNEIDLANPKTNRKNAGFSDEERSGMTELLKHGFVDTFRELYPKEEKAYSFWTYMGNARGKNVGWRLDYSLVSENLKSKVVDSFMRPQVLGSDHCPIVLLMNI